MGRVIAALCNDPDLMQQTGKVQIAAELAANYRIVDEHQHHPVSLRSLRFLYAQGLPMLKSRAKFIPDLRASTLVDSFVNCSQVSQNLKMILDC